MTRQEAETLRQARAGALAAAGYAQSFINDGHTRLGALIALSVTPESRLIDDAHYVDEVGAALANALTRPLEIMRFGHDNEVNSAAFSPDGSRIVSGSTDATLRLWDAGIFVASLEELANKAEKLCPLSLVERQQLRLVDPEADSMASPLTPDQRRACGD